MDSRAFDPLEDETVPSAPEDAAGGPDPWLSRRRLLGGAGGLVLAAGGLLVAEAAAGQRPKGKKPKGKKPKDKCREPGTRPLTRDVELNFYSGHELTHEIEVWQVEQELEDGWFLKWPRQTVPPVRQMVKFTGSDLELVLVVFTSSLELAPLYFRVTNPPIGKPKLVVQRGSWSKRGVVNPGASYADQGVDVGERVTVPYFYVDRSPDSADHKIFYINASD